MSRPVFPDKCHIKTVTFPPPTLHHVIDKRERSCTNQRSFSKPEGKTAIVSSLSCHVGDTPFCQSRLCFTTTFAESWHSGIETVRTNFSPIVKFNRKKRRRKRFIWFLLAVIVTATSAAHLTFFYGHVMRTSYFFTSVQVPISCFFFLTKNKCGVKLL